MYAEDEFKGLYRQFAELPEAGHQPPAIRLVQWLCHAMFVEFPEWQQQGLAPVLEPFVLRSATYQALATQLRVDDDAIPHYRPYDSFGIYVLQPANPRTDAALVVYRKVYRNRKVTDHLDLNRLSVSTLRNIAQHLLDNKCPLLYKMEHEELRRAAYRVMWERTT